MSTCRQSRADQKAWISDTSIRDVLSAHVSIIIIIIAVVIVIVIIAVIVM